jgi:hypothetical protein
VPLRQRAGRGADEGRALQPRRAHRELGGGRARRRQGRPRRARGDVPGGHALGRPEDPRDGDHRRARADGARALRRRPRLHRPRRQAVFEALAVAGGLA